MKASIFVNHYEILGLSSFETDCTKLSEANIKAAYHKKALQVHPDTIKRKGITDINAHVLNITSMTAAFQQLHASYQVLMDNMARKKYDETWLEFQRQEKERRDRENQIEKEMKSKEESESRRKEKKDSKKKQKQYNDNITPMSRGSRLNRVEELRKLEEIMRLNKEFFEELRKIEKQKLFEESRRHVEAKEKKLRKPLDKSKVLRVRWNRDVGNYTESELRKVFEQIGKVKDVRVRKNNGEKTNKRSLALVVMSSTQSVIAATTATWNHLLPPLDVWPLQV